VNTAPHATPPGVGHEHADVNVRPIVVAGFGLAIVLIIVAGLMLGPFYGVQGGGNGGDTLTFYTNGYGMQHPSGNSEIKQVYLTAGGDRDAPSP
jgi:hypothetical protein